MEDVHAPLEDLVVLSSTWEQHLKTLRTLLELQTANLIISFVKSEPGHVKLEYLGHMVAGGVVAPLHPKVEAISNFPVSTSSKSSDPWARLVITGDSASTSAK